MIELDLINLNLEAVLLSVFLIVPRIRYLHQTLHIFHYLKKNHVLVVDGFNED